MTRPRTLPEAEQDLGATERSLAVTPYLQDADFTLWNGDARQVLSELPDESVHMCVTSPPFFGLRDYGTGSWEGGDQSECICRSPQACDTASECLYPDPDRRTPVCDHLRQSAVSRESSGLDGATTTQGGAYAWGDTCGKCGATRVDNQIGLEATPEEWVEQLVAVFEQVRRVLRKDGTLWVECGDSYSGSWSGHSIRPDGGEQREGGPGFQPLKDGRYTPKPTKHPGCKPKDLIGQPFLLAFALREAGWYWRGCYPWAKSNPMPESVTDRFTTSHSYVLHFSKNPRYFHDNVAVMEPVSPLSTFREWDGVVRPSSEARNLDAASSERFGSGSRGDPSGRNRRSVISLPTQAYAEAHFATWPEKLVELFIKAGTSERGCCPECGAPWQRIIETNNPSKWAADDNDLGWSNTHSKTSNAQSSKSLHRNPGGVYSTAVEKGWELPCNCGTLSERAYPQTSGVTPTGVANVTARSESAPCTVLDPFGGSGTTALVARRLGRKAILVELNEAYCALSAKRTQQLSLEASA